MQLGSLTLTWEGEDLVCRITPGEDCDRQALFAAINDAVLDALTSRDEPDQCEAEHESMTAEELMDGILDVTADEMVRRVRRFLRDHTLADVMSVAAHLGAAVLAGPIFRPFVPVPPDAPLDPIDPSDLDVLYRDNLVEPPPAEDPPSA